MTHLKRSCPVHGLGDEAFDHELREILSAMFCACLDEMQSGDTLQRRDLFNLTEINHQTLPAAAEALGIGVRDAELMLTQTRREVAVLMVLGLCKTSGAGSADAPRPSACNCRKD